MQRIYSKNKLFTKPRLLIGSPELTLGEEAGIELPGPGLNFSMGGMAPVNSSYAVGFMDEGTFRVSVGTPKWESSLRDLNDMSTTQIKNIEHYLPDNLFLISHPSFNKTKVEGSNTRMYDDTSRFTAIDRGIAFSAGIVNAVLPNVRPDIFWGSDWMPGPAAVVAKAMGIKVVSTGHSIHSQVADIESVINKGIELRNFDDYNPRDLIWKQQGTENMDFLASKINAADDFFGVSPEFVERILYTDKFDNMSPEVVKAIREKAKYKHSDGRPRVHGYLNPLEKEKSEFLTDIKKYGLEQTITKRKQNREKIDEISGLKRGGNLLAFPNRLAKQKEPDFFLDNIIYLASKYNFRALILANGEKEWVDKSKKVAFESNGLVSYIPYDKETEELLKQSYKVFLLNTADWEPCGNQLNYAHEGIPALAHSVDGIKDSITQLDFRNSRGNGFPYNNTSLYDLEGAVIKLKEFSNITDHDLYSQLIRIAKETEQNHSVKTRVKQLVDNIFWPLYLEGMNKKDRRNAEITRYLGKVTNLF